MSSLSLFVAEMLQFKILDVKLKLCSLKLMLKLEHLARVAVEILSVGWGGVGSPSFPSALEHPTTRMNLESETSAVRAEPRSRRLSNAFLFTPSFSFERV